MFVFLGYFLEIRPTDSLHFYCFPNSIHKKVGLLNFRAFSGVSEVRMAMVSPSGLSSLLGLGRVVEGPAESDLGRVGLDAAGDVRRLHLGHAVHLDAARHAHRRDCGKAGQIP